MSIIQGNAKQGSTRGFYDFPLEQSLRFNDGDTPYLTWTPATAGDRKTWTFSFWVKRATIGQLHSIFSATNASGVTYIGFYNDTLRFLWNGGGANASDTTMVFRDPSAWYHIVVVWDTVSGGQGHKVYVNGESVTVSIPSPTTNTETGIGDTVAQKISSYVNLYYMDGYLAEVNFLNGIAATADDFGELKNGVWIPKEYTGAYDSAAQVTAGNLNGFRLSFADDAEVEAFNTVLYRGNGATTTSTQSVTGVGFSPDLVWIKNRDNTTSNSLYDTIRGADVTLRTNTTDKDFDYGNTLLSFDSDGFTVGNYSHVNGNGLSHVAWCWKAGGSSNTYNIDDTGYATASAAGLDGGTTTPTGASISTTYGFAIIAYTGASSASTEINHGLGSAPAMIIIKSRDEGTTDYTGQWDVYHKDARLDSDQGYLVLNSGAGQEDGPTNVFNAEPTSSSFFIGNAGAVNQSPDNYIAYCWAEKTGYSKFGINTTSRVSCGFKPALVILKDTATSGSWYLLDNTRDADGDFNHQLYAQLSNTEDAPSTSTLTIDDGTAYGNDGGGFTVTWTAQTDRYGTGVIYAAFADTREAAFWLDQSGNDNDWQPVNLDHNDTLADSPTDNFATFNSLNITSTAGSLSDGNLTSTGSSASLVLNSRSTMAFSSGKWYAEFTINDQSQTNYPQIGILTTRDAARSGIQAGYSSGFSDASASVAYLAGGNKSISASTSTYGASFVAGDVISIALDADNGAVYFAKNGEWADGAGNCDETFANAVAALTWTGGDYEHVISVADYNGTSVTANFGQQPFKYDPPA